MDRPALVPMSLQQQVSALQTGLQYLDTVEIVSFVETDLTTCERCGEPRFRLLDESKCRIVPGYCQSTLNKRCTSPYEYRMELVRSGLFTREQLRSSNLGFNSHELDINARCFNGIRPYQCPCYFGAPEEHSEEWLAHIMRSIDPPLSTDNHPMDELFLGNPLAVVKNRHLRSPAARRRRYKKKRKGVILRTTVLPMNRSDYPMALRLEHPVEVVLRFNYFFPSKKLEILPIPERKVGKLVKGRDGPYVRYYTRTEYSKWKPRTRRRFNTLKKGA